MEMASEMMDDALESTLDGDEVEDETNELVDQVGTQMAEQPQGLPLLSLYCHGHDEARRAKRNCTGGSAAGIGCWVTK